MGADKGDAAPDFVRAVLFKLGLELGGDGFDVLFEVGDATTQIGVGGRGVVAGIGVHLVAVGLHLGQEVGQRGRRALWALTAVW